MENQGYETSERARKVINRYERMNAMKQPWLPLWQVAGAFVIPTKRNFYNDLSDGQPLTAEVFDTTAISACQQSASTLAGALWPNGPKTFVFDAPDDMDDDLKNNAEIKSYYATASKRMYSAMDNPEASLQTSIFEYMHDQLGFGTSAVFVEENFGPDQMEKPVRYYPLDCKKICISEGPDGFVDTVYIKKVLTVKQVVQEYGIDKVSKRTRDSFLNENGDEKVEIIQAIEPRIDDVKPLFGSLAMPIASIHVEVSGNCVLRETGYEEMPVFVTRFWKAMGEVYGRAPGTEFLPDIIEANFLREMLAVAVEKKLNPPGILNYDGSLGGGTFNTSAGAVNIRNISGRMQDTGKAWEPLFDVGDVSLTEEHIKELQQIIERGFYIDRLNDLGNDSRMTGMEANIRNEMRGQSLNTTYSRQYAELFTRLIRRTAHIMFNKGLLGVPANSPQALQSQQQGIKPLIIPDALLQRLANKQSFYKITYISPAIRMMKLEELNAITNIMGIAEKIGAIKSEVLDAINFDRLFLKLQELTGAPPEIVNSSEEIQAIRQSRAQQMQEAAQAAKGEQVALTAKHAGQAADATSKSGLPPTAILDAIAAQGQGQGQGQG